MTTFNTMEEFLEILRSRPDLLEAARQVILVDELLELPRRLAEFVAVTNENFQLVNERLARLEGDVAELKGDVAELKGDVAELKSGQIWLTNEANQSRGERLERRVHAQITSIVPQRLGLRRVRVVKSAMQVMTETMQDLIDDAEDEAVITPSQAAHLRAVDIILSAQRRDTREPVYVAMEVSNSIGPDDVVKANDRAHSLASVTGVTTIAVVIGGRIIDAARQRAGKTGVQVITPRLMTQPSDETTEDRSDETSDNPAAETTDVEDWMLSEATER